MSEVQRRNITLPKASCERLAKLKGDTDATSDSEVIRYALLQYERYLEREKTESAVRHESGASEVRA